MKNLHTIVTTHSNIRFFLALIGAGLVVIVLNLIPFDLPAFNGLSVSHPVSNQLVFVTLSDSDIEALGGWPVSRDYFGYMIHALSKCGAKTIGLDFLFDTSDSLFKEYDAALAGFIRSSGNIVLPAVIQSMDHKNSEVLLPAESFRNAAAGVGFSNLGDESTSHRLPLTAYHGDSLLLSFGLELARHYLGAAEPLILEKNRLVLSKPDGTTRTVPVNKNGWFIPNYFGNLNQVQQIGFVKLLKTFQDHPDSLDLRGKLVLVAPTAQTLPVIKTIPRFGNVPGSLIHLTVAENIITNNILRPMPSAFVWILSFLLAAVCCIVMDRNLFRIGLLLFGGLSIFFSGLVVFSPSLLHRIMPIQPFLLSGLGFVIFCGSHIGSRVHRIKTTNRLLEDEIRKTRKELEEAQSGLMKTQTEKDTAVHRLEKHLRDLEAIRLPEETGTSEFPHIIHAPGGRMAMTLTDIPHLAESDIPVLIQGETGTGKELVARAIHQSSGRKEKPFLAVNCGALSENLLESELFGHEKGSFTGAVSRRIGRFERANGGTLFLDEISETSPTFQSKLLRVLQEGAFERVGGNETIHVNVRIVAATNQNLEERIRTGTFRSDLFYRLNGFVIPLPPLRERTEDIPLLIRHFLKRHGYSDIRSVSDQAMGMIRRHRWTGNVRELENTIRRAGILAQKRKSAVIQIGDLPEQVCEAKPESAPPSAFVSFEKQVLESLRSFQFSRSAISLTAKALGNKDRGTITEYFRGICFQALVEREFSISEACREIVGTDTDEIVRRVETKIRGYLDGLSGLEKSDWDKDNLPAAFKGLPKQFHPFLHQIIRNLDTIR